jgi:hypothetical protein
MQGTKFCTSGTPERQDCSPASILLRQSSAHQEDTRREGQISSTRIDPDGRWGKLFEASKTSGTGRRRTGSWQR